MSIPSLSRCKRLLLLQLPPPPPGPVAVRGNIPLAAGYLVASLANGAAPHSICAEIHPPALTNRLGDDALIADILARRPDIVGFSLYVWNAVRSLRLARRLKRERPELLVIVGGPEVQPDNDWLCGQSGFDVAVRGEGERTFPALLGALNAGADLSRVPGLLLRQGERFVPTGRRRDLDTLDIIPSPYEVGLLDPAEEGMMLVETTRGCRHRCAFCAYPSGRRRRARLSEGALRRALAFAVRRRVREIYLLDPSLEDGRSLDALTALIAEANCNRALRFFGELRAEAVSPEIAASLAAAGFHEVEVGLQSIGRPAQRKMGRRNDLIRFGEGARALQEAGIRVRTDAIVGLPGDTPQTIAATLDFISGLGLGADALVFPLAVLPGTAFRRRAEVLGLLHQPHPPYQIRATPTLAREDLVAAFEGAGRLFGHDYAPHPSPCLIDPALAGDGLGARQRIVVNGASAAEAAKEVCSAPDASFTLWLVAKNPYAARAALAAAVRTAAARNPHGVLHVVLETGEEFPFDVLDSIFDAWRPPDDHYLEAFHEAPAPHCSASRRLFVLLPAAAAAMLDLTWRDALPEPVEVAWRLPAGTLRETLGVLAKLPLGPLDRVVLGLRETSDRATLRRLAREAQRLGVGQDRILHDRAGPHRLWQTGRSGDE